MTRAASALPRRSLAGLAGLLLPAEAGAARLPAASPDAELIRLAQAHEKLGHEYNKTSRAAGDLVPGCSAYEATDAKLSHITCKQGKLLDAMLDTRPTTLAGLQAIAAALVVWDLELLQNEEGDSGQCMTALLVRSLLDMRGAS